MASLTVGFQAALMARQWPDWNSLVYPTLLAVLFCMNGMRLFRKHARDMVDEL
jgi:lipopolysaccharide transport system permease protein